MEHTLRAKDQLAVADEQIVLILVLVEHTLRGLEENRPKVPLCVLILVLVEHTLRANKVWRDNNGE